MITTNNRPYFEEGETKRVLPVSTGILSMDGRYLRLAGCIDGFCGDPEDYVTSPTQIVENFGRLLTEAAEYFSYEERIMRNIGLPSYEHHKQSHKRILRDLEEYYKTLPNHPHQGTISEIHNYLSQGLCRPLEIENRMIRNHLHRELLPAEGIIAACAEKAVVRPTILIADDEPIDLQVIGDILKRDYRILLALSGADTLRMAETQEPDLILLDIVMADVDGFTVCRRLKENPLIKDIPVIFVTAMNEVDDEAKGLEMGAIDYITKPIQPIIVRNRVRNHLELKAQRDTLRSLSVIDGLTGITNRRGFDDALKREWRRAMQNKSTISLAIADIDHFKAYNDCYGHLAGDDCLRTVSGAFHRQMRRPTDLAARYGGEELICLLPDTDAAGAHLVVRRILAELTALAIRHEASPVASVVTVSVGIATAPAGTAGTQQELLALADHYLYEAKNSGRNQMKAGLLGGSRSDLL
ncbi:two-component system, chemotaxis family, response regulator WspR [Gammaproteobacteria bacterium]